MNNTFLYGRSLWRILLHIGLQPIRGLPCKRWPNSRTETDKAPERQPLEQGDPSLLGLLLDGLEVGTVA